MNKLHINTLPKEQQILWKELGLTPKHFTLYGGTALALQLGHRISIDFDFFSNESFDPDELFKQIPYLKGSIKTKTELNTLTCHVIKDNKEVQVSFFGDLELPALKKPILAENGIKIASAEDVLTTKLKTIMYRGSYKDYIDIASGLENGYKLEKLVKNTKKLYGKQFNPAISLKSLSYFDDIKNIDDKTKKVITKHLRNFLNKGLDI